jgi:hypothetical protein
MRTELLIEIKKGAIDGHERLKGGIAYRLLHDDA